MGSQPGSDMDQATEILHATAVAGFGSGVLIVGPSGSGKSALALDLMALGCALVADDRAEVFRKGSEVWVRSPPAIAGMIEARGVGILAADAEADAPVRLVVDLGQAEPDRLPPHRMSAVLGVQVPLLWAPPYGHFAAAILQLLKRGRSA